MRIQKKIAFSALIVLFIIASVFALRGNTPVRAAEKKTELFLPSGYEQYLPLSDPKDVAINDEYIAVADGSFVYLYDRVLKGEYRVYRHRPNSSTPIYISKLQFSKDGKLYLADTAQELFELRPDTLSISAPLLSLSTFHVTDEYLYAVTVAPATGTTVYQLSLDKALSIDAALNSKRLDPNPITPSITFANGTLYCAVSGTVYSYSETLEPQPAFLLDKNLGYRIETNSICALDDSIYYTDVRGLQRTDAEGNSEIVYQGSGFAALSANGDKLYCIKGATVRELLVKDGKAAYTGYEIASSSDSVNRLCGATESVRAGALVVTADRGNERISVYDKEKNEFTLLACGAATAVATDGNVIAAAVGNSISLYNRGSTEPFYTHSASNRVTGVAVVYGKCYYLTALGYGEAVEDAQEIFRADAHTSLTSDIYGNLYVAETNNQILKYTEEEFLNSAAEGETVTNGWALPDSYASLRADFEGNLYYLNDGAIYKNGVYLTPLPGNELVYHGAEAASPLSFALGFEDNGLYVQFGDYMVYTREIDVPNLSQIATEEIYKTAFAVSGREELTFADVAENTVGIHVELGALEAESAYFDTAGYGRTNGGRGILLGKTGHFSLVALYRDFKYEISLFPTENCIETKPQWEAVDGAKQYLTNEVALSYHPCLAEPLTIERLPRSTEVTVLAHVRVENGDGFDYAFVETKNGARGYVPLNYLTENVPFLADPDAYTLGYLKANADGVVFRSEDGSSLIVTERKQVKIYDTGDGLYFARFTQDGVEYTAQITRNMIERGNQTALYTSIIIILCVIAIGIIAVYVLLRKKKKK